METKKRCLGNLEHHGDFDPDEEQNGLDLYKGLDVYIVPLKDREPVTKEQSEHENEKKSGNEKEKENKDDTSTGTEEGGTEVKDDGEHVQDDVNNDHEFEKLTGDDTEVVVSTYVDNQKEEIIKDKDGNETQDNEMINNNEMKNASVKKKEQVETKKEKQDEAYKVEKTKDVFKWKKADGKYYEAKQYEAFSKTMKSELKKDAELKKMKDLEMLTSTLSSTTMTKQERESMLYDKFDKFTSEAGESIYSHYMRFAKLINDMNMIRMSITPIYVPTVIQQPPTFQPDAGLAIATFLLSDDLIKSLNKAMIFLSSITQATIQNGQVTVQNVQGRQSQGYTGNARNNQASGAWVINTVGNTRATQPRADHVDAYDSDYDEEATTNAIFMASLSHVGSLDDDTVAPCYDSYTLYEVPYYDTYHDSYVLNSNIQELEYIENIVSNNKSYDELKGNSNVISYTDYMLTIGNDKDNYVPLPVQKNDMMLS
ncbi:hypothetical protein Tco_0287265, partial [Tanacetum coccineum]